MALTETLILGHEVYLSPLSEKPECTETSEQEQTHSSTWQSCAEVNFEILARPHLM